MHTVTHSFKLISITHTWMTAHSTSGGWLGMPTLPVHWPNQLQLYKGGLESFVPPQELDVDIARNKLSWRGVVQHERHFRKSVLRPNGSGTSLLSCWDRPRTTGEFAWCDPVDKESGESLKRVEVKSTQVGPGFHLNLPRSGYLATRHWRPKKGRRARTREGYLGMTRVDESGQKVAKGREKSNQ